MLLVALLFFCKVLDDMDLKPLRENAEIPVKIMNDLLLAEEDLKKGKIFDTNAETSPAGKSDTLPPLVPFEFPSDFYEKQGKKIIEAVEVKMGKFFGTSNADKLKNFDTPEGMLECLSNMDFNNHIVNFIVRKCITYLKPTEQLPLEGIIDRKSCKKACRKNPSASIAFVHRVFQYFISQVTDEDLRFRIFQDPKKCFEYSFDREKNKHYCKCVDKGYQVKVSPRLLEIFHSKLNDTRGVDLAKQLEEENSVDIANAENYFNFRKMTNLALYFSGFSSTSKSRRADDHYKHNMLEFIYYHLLLSIFLFIFCHCLWYIHIIYFVILFVSEYIL